MLNSVGYILIIPRVDRLQARLLDRKPQQPSASGNDCGRRLRTYIAFCEQPNPIGSDLLDRANTRNFGKMFREPLPFRLDFNIEAAAENFPPQVGARANQDNVAL